MPTKRRNAISSKDIEKLLKDRGLEVRRQAGHMLVRTARGGVFFPIDTEISPVMMAIIRRDFINHGILSKNEFDRFVAQHSPLLERVIGDDLSTKKSTPLYLDVRDPVLKQRLSQLGSPPFDTLVREAGVVLEDRLRRVAGEEATNLHGVALVDTLLIPDKARIIFSENPGEQDGARLLYRGAMQFIRNPVMHRLIEYPEKEARIFIGVIDSLLQLLSEVAPEKHINSA